MPLTIPTFAEDRGPIKVDPDTGSTKSKPASYCRDLKGCGEKDYSFGQMSISINECTNCVREFKGSLSLNYIVDTGLAWADVELMLTEVTNDLESAFKTCPENQAPTP